MKTDTNHKRGVVYLPIRQFAEGTTGAERSLSPAAFGALVGRAAADVLRQGAEPGSLDDVMAQSCRTFAQFGAAGVISWIDEQLAGQPSPVTLSEIPEVPMQSTAPARPRDRDSVFATIETRAFAERRPGQTDAQAIDSYITRNPTVYREYLGAQEPEPTQMAEQPADTDAGRAYAAIERRALAERRPGETNESAVARYVTANPAIYREYVKLNNARRMPR